MCEMHLRQPGFMYSACKSFTKNKKPIQNFKETVNSRHIYQNELDRACFKDGMAYRNFKDFPRRIAAGEVLHDKALNIPKNIIYDGYQSGIASMVYKLFDKNTVRDLNLRELRKINLLLVVLKVKLDKN